jgi:uncharacterized Tic20 family protein
MNKRKDKTGLFDETRLLDVYRIALKTGPNRLNVGVALVVALASFIYSVESKDNLGQVLDIARTTAGDGLAFSSSILGFLIAGFAIFLTPTRPELFVRMQESIHPKTGYTYLKYNLSGFVVVFIHYFLFAATCFIFKSFGGVGGPFSMALSKISIINYNLYEKIRFLGITCFFVGVESWFIYLLMLMKSFIFNLYHIVMTMVAFEIDDRKKQAAEKNNVRTRRTCRLQRWKR